METSETNRPSLNFIEAEINTLDPLDIKNSDILYLIHELTTQKTGLTIYLAQCIFSEVIQIII